MAGFEDIDWDEMDKFLEDWKDMNKFQEEFSDEIITELALYYLKHRGEFYLKTEEEFVIICKKEARLTAYDFFFTLSDLLYHYDKKEGNFLDFDDLEYHKYEDNYQADHFEVLMQYPHMTREAVDEAKEEAKRDHYEMKKYVEDFHKLVKKFVVKYVHQVENLPARALRELDLLCYLKMDDFQSDFDKLSDPDTVPWNERVYKNDKESK